MTTKPTKHAEIPCTERFWQLVVYRARLAGMTIGEYIRLALEKVVKEDD